MAASSSVALWRDIETLFDSGTAHVQSDRQLLDRFIKMRGPAAEAAFEVLVLRHGPMVLRLCRNLFSDPNDAQDAFQATFLVLVERSRSVRHLESLGGWLAGVCHRVAARVRVEAARRHKMEGRAALRVVGAVAPATDDLAERAECSPIVQQEVRWLPERYRGVLVLCYWEGLTQEQAAARLGCPLGTVRSRLARARVLLKRRLTHRGLAPLAAALAAGLGSASSSASTSKRVAVPPELAQSTIRAAIRVASSQPLREVVSGVVASSFHRILWSMAMIKVKSVVAGFALIALAGYGVGLAAQKSRQTQTKQEVGQADRESAAPAVPRVGPRFQTDTQGAPESRGQKAVRFTTIYSNVQGQTTLLRIVPNGALVKKGEVIGELDSAVLKDNLINQQITSEAAKAIFHNATLSREDAELALQSYRDDLAPREQREVEEEAKIAQLELTVAEEELKSIKSVGEKSELAIKRAELALARARFTKEKADNRRHIFTQYSKDRTVKELTGKLEAARSNERARQASWDLARVKEKRLEKQIAACTLVAPIDGTVVHPESIRGEVPTGDPPRLLHTEAGATVRERQIILRIVPATRGDSGDR